MGRYVAKRIATSILTFFGTIILTFILFRLLPGNPIQLLFRNPQLTQKQIQLLNSQFGLNKPLWLQFVLFVRNVFVGNWGISFSIGHLSRRCSFRRC